MQPLANSNAPDRWVSTCTGTTAPAFGPEPTVRVSNARPAMAVTDRTGPRACTSAVR